jgi:hypothetical protein
MRASCRRGIAGIRPGSQAQAASSHHHRQNTASHDWHGTTPVLRKILEDTGCFEVRVMKEFRGAGPETPAPYDVVILSYYDGRKPDLRWGERPTTRGWPPPWTAGRNTRSSAASTGALTTATIRQGTITP